MTLQEILERQEGFREKPYQCSQGVWTVGHGFTSLSLDESRVVLAMKIEKLRNSLQPTIENLSPGRQDVLVNMAYNLGITGLFGFKDMWLAIYRQDFEEAARCMLDSKWARQVGSRAISLAVKMEMG